MTVDRFHKSPPQYKKSPPFYVCILLDVKAPNAMSIANSISRLNIIVICVSYIKYRFMPVLKSRQFCIFFGSTCKCAPKDTCHISQTKHIQPPKLWTACELP